MHSHRPQSELVVKASPIEFLRILDHDNDFCQQLQFWNFKLAVICARIHDH